MDLQRSWGDKRKGREGGGEVNGARAELEGARNRGKGSGAREKLEGGRKRERSYSRARRKETQSWRNISFWILLHKLEPN